VSYSRVPLIVAGVYAAMVLFFLSFAIIVGIIGEDEFGYGGVPVLFATYPLGFLLYYKNHNFLFSIGIGAGVNCAILYALLKAFGYAIASSRKQNERDRAS
jgi:hypothetical protein